MMPNLRTALLAATLLASTVCAAAQTNHSKAPEPTLLISGARIVDGSGKQGFAGSVRLRGSHIIEVGALKAHPGEQTLDAGGLTLAPGFIDTHSHHDSGLFEHREALAAVSQGITTIVAGQDGGGDLPVAKLFASMSSTPPALNVATYVGHNSVRDAVMGQDFKRKASEAEIKKMAALVEQGMKDGALGLSSGLEYDPGIYSSHDEVLSLARVAAGYGGRYISHIRSEDREEWQALDEIINIGRVTGMPVQVSHMKLAMSDWWGQADKFLGIMDRARAQGVKITGDVYPYEYWHSTLTVLFPQRDFTNRTTAEYIFAHVAPADGLLISDFSPEPALVDHTVAQIAKMRGTDPATTLMALIKESQVPGAEESVIGTSMRADDVEKLIAWPHSNICSDGALEGGHPRNTGTFTKVLRVYVRERHTLSLEAAIHKMTAEAAEHVGIHNRGLIAPGQFADLVLFDPATVSDHSTTKEPRKLSTGIAKVWVNGEIVFADGHPSGALPGVGIRRVDDKRGKEPIK